MKLLLSITLIITIILNILFIFIRIYPNILFTPQDQKVYNYRLPVDRYVVSLNQIEAELYFSEDSGSISFSTKNFSKVQLEFFINNFTVEYVPTISGFIFLKEPKCKFIDITVNSFNNNFREINNIRCIK